MKQQLWQFRKYVCVEIIHEMFSVLSNCSLYQFKVKR